MLPCSDIKTLWHVIHEFMFGMTVNTLSAYCSVKGRHWCSKEFAIFCHLFFTISTVIRRQKAAILLRLVRIIMMLTLKQQKYNEGIYSWLRQFGAHMKNRIKNCSGPRPGPPHIDPGPQSAPRRGPGGGGLTKPLRHYDFYFRKPTFT